MKELSCLALFLSWVGTQQCLLSQLQANPTGAELPGTYSYTGWAARYVSDSGACGMWEDTVFVSRLLISDEAMWNCIGLCATEERFAHAHLLFQNWDLIVICTHLAPSANVLETLNKNKPQNPYGVAKFRDLLLHNMLYNNSRILLMNFCPSITCIQCCCFSLQTENRIPSLIMAACMQVL